MHLNPDYVVQDICGDHTLVPIRGAAKSFHGIIRCNDTAACIIDCLKQETTEQDIIAVLEAKYNADHTRIASNVADMLNTLRSVGALVE